MSNVWGKRIKLSIFGESHGAGIGIVMGNLPPGQRIDLEEAARHMQRRAPGGALATKRREKDQVEIISGLFEGKTSGAPLCGLIRNTDMRSQDYNPALPRPGHSDYTAQIKYRGHQDYRGGGHFSGRLTAPLTFAGSIARQYLAAKNIHIGAYIRRIGSCIAPPLAEINAETLAAFSQQTLPVGDKKAEAAMIQAIEEIREEGDSLGGIIEGMALGFPPGFGAPFFYSLESALAGLAFSIPGVKGIEFGSGFEMAAMRGSQANDSLYMEEKQIKTHTNHSGGINGGLSNGMPIVLRLAVRPTPSISLPQATVDLNKQENAVLEIKGRHDPCIVPRAVVVVESILALALLDALLEGGWQ